jgi:hypothetical protein
LKYNEKYLMNAAVGYLGGDKITEIDLRHPTSPCVVLEPISKTPSGLRYLPQLPRASAPRNRGEKRGYDMASKMGRKCGNWRTPPGRLMRCVLNVLMREQRDRAYVVSEFERLIPEYQKFHNNPVGKGAIWGRADAGVRAGRFEREHPDKNPHIGKYIPAAEKIVADGKPVTVQQVSDIVAAVDGAPNEETALPAAAQSAFSPPLGARRVPSPSIPASPPRILLGASSISTVGKGGPVYWSPAELMNYGMLVTGDSGSGKTQLIRAVIDGVVQAGLPVAVFDFKNDYASAEFANPLGLRVYDVDRDGLPFNPLALVADERGEVHPIRHAHELAFILKRAFGLGDVQAARLKEAVASAFYDAGISPRLRHQLADLPPAPSFAKVVDVLKADSDNDNRSLLARLGPLDDLDLFPASDRATDEFDSMLTDRVVIDLHRLPNDAVKAALTEFFIVRMHGHLLRGDQPRAFRRLVVLDEAHRLAENDRLVALAREGRAFGVGIALGTQFPGDLPIELSGNLGTKIFLRNSEDKHRRAIAKALVGTLQGYSAEQVFKEAGCLHQHQALIKNSKLTPYLSVDLLPHYRRSLDTAAD